VTRQESTSEMQEMFFHPLAAARGLGRCGDQRQRGNADQGSAQNTQRLRLSGQLTWENSLTPGKAMVMIRKATEGADRRP
jgi:hypothetical protein